MGNLRPSLVAGRHLDERSPPGKKWRPNVFPYSSTRGEGGVYLGNDVRGGAATQPWFESPRRGFDGPI